MTNSGPGQRRQRNQRGSGEHLRLEILDAAMRVLDGSPGADLSLRRVALEAGITPPSIYTHFATREEMVAAVIRECWNQLAEDLGRAARRARSQGPIDRLNAQMRAYVRYAMDRPSRYQLLFALPPALAAQSQVRTRPVEPAFVEIVAVIKECEAAGCRIAMNDVEGAALFVLSVAHGRVALAHTAPDQWWNTQERVVSFIRTALRELIGPVTEAAATVLPPV